MPSTVSSTPSRPVAPRRQALLRVAALVVGLGWGGLGAALAALPTYTVSTAQLQDMVAQKFPRMVPLAGLAQLTVQAPQLRMLAESNRLHADMLVEAASPALLRRPQQGSLAVEFALRYEASDRTVRAHQISLGRLSFVSLQPAVVDLLNAYAPRLAEQTLDEVVLHQLSAKDLVLFDGLGLQPGAITVTPRGLRVGLVRKPL
jgi:hypothetical protein